MSRLVKIIDFIVALSLLMPLGTRQVFAAQHHVMNPEDLNFPEFKLPYSSSSVKWTGGPHAYGLLDALATFDPGQGSGLDFANDSTFDVLAMASGDIIEASCSGYGSFGCIVAIKHDVGGSVLVYAHLEEASVRQLIERFQLDQRLGLTFWAPQGAILGKAGRSGGNWPIHLHIELRDGSNSCSARCLPGNLGGNPVGWDELVALVDEYLISGYFDVNGDLEPIRAYNYDGSAVKGVVVENYNFQYLDQPGAVQRTVATRVDSTFICDSPPDCEENGDPYAGSTTQFAGNGVFPSGLHSSSVGSGGFLVSSNIPVWISPPIPSGDDGTFISDITLPDGAVVAPGQSLVKTWRMLNTGTSTWGAGYELAFISGDQMSAPGSVAVPTAAPGQEVDISVNLVSPSVEGEYTGYWQMRNPQGTYFGEQIWVSIRVQNSAPPSGDAVDLTCLDCPSEVLPGATFRPTVQAKINSGQLLESRGDMLLNTDGNLFGAWPHIAVVGSVNEGGTYNFTFYENDPLNAPTTPGTYETKWRVWRDGHYDGDEITITFTVGGTTNYPPSAPTPLSPANWAVFDGPSGITLSAQQNGDPDGDSITAYYFEIFESAQIPNSGWIAESQWNPPGLGTYTFRWHVKVRDSRGAESDWSEAWNFTVEDPNPQIYDFHYRWMPEWITGGPEIEFCADTNADGVEFWVNLAEDGSDQGEWRYLYSGPPDMPCLDDHVSAHAILWQLGYNGIHRVRIYAIKSGGRAYQDLILENLPPTRRPNGPGLIYPVNLYVASETIHFSWRETLRTTSYSLQASTDPGYGTLLLDVNLPFGTNEYEYTFSPVYEPIYWRVIANGPYGTHGTENFFHIDITPPSSAVSALPPVTTDTSTSVNWSGTDDRSGVRWYHIQVKDATRPDVQWTDWLVNTTKTGEIFQGQAGHTYYFRVRAMDNVGQWEAWPQPEEQGDTFTMLDPSAAPSDTWWDVNYAWKRNLTVLNNVPDYVPAHFPIHIHFDGTTTPTAAEIYDASVGATKGDDVRIVYNNQTELDRQIQHFTSDRIDIWFPLQADLGGGQSLNAAYQIYYGNPAASNPPADINAIFMPAADANTVALYHFQEGSGSTVYDNSGHGHTGNFLNAGWGDGMFGNAGYFNGVNSCVELGTSSDFTSAAFTVEAWVYMTNNQYEPMVVMKGNSSEHHVYRIKGLSTGDYGQLDFNLFTGDVEKSISTPTGSFIPNQWYHFAAVNDGNGHMWLYINGISRSYNDNAGIINLFDRPVYIGCAPWWPYVWFPGYVQHVRFSNIVRNDFPYARITTEPSVAAGSPFSPPVEGAPDLAIIAMNMYPYPDGGYLVQAIVQNQGDADTRNGFYIDLYANEVPTGAGQYGIQFWLNDPIVAGAAVTLTTVVNELPGMNLQAMAPASDANATLYSQADSAGAVSEPDESNNIYASGLPICFTTQDAFEGDDDVTQATLIGLNQWQTHNIDTLGDQDWFRFSAQADQAYVLRTFNLGGSSDTYIYLYDTDGTTLLASSDDYNGTLASLIQWTAPEDGTYYILVKHWNPNVGGCGTQYTFVIELPGQPTSDVIYMPIIQRSGVSSSTRTFYGLSGDVEIGMIGCQSWSDCRNSSWSNFMLPGYNGGTVEGTLYDGEYGIKRILFYFDTSALPSNAIINSVELQFYVGDYVTGDSTVYVVQSHASYPPAISDFDEIVFTSGGQEKLSPSTWFNVNLYSTAFGWVNRDGITSLALLQSNDFKNIAPTTSNAASITLAEDSTYRPRLVVKYSIP